MKDFVGIVLIVLAAMISESISQSKHVKKEKRIEKEEVLKTDSSLSNFSKSPKTLGETYQILLDSTLTKKDLDDHW